MLWWPVSGDANMSPEGVRGAEIRYRNVQRIGKPTRSKCRDLLLGFPTEDLQFAAVCVGKKSLSDLVVDVLELDAHPPQ